MREKIFTICFLLTCIFSMAQVGIGTTTPYAQLDVVSNTPGNPTNIDGVLVPRVSVFPSINPTNFQNGMLLFLTNTAIFASVSRAPGFYYWDSLTSNWIGIQTNPTTNWNLLGNATTNPSTNFIGTTDNIDLVFRRNNSRAGFIGDPTYDASFNYNNGNTSFGANSLLNPTINIASQNGVRNVAFGSNIMPGLTTGIILEPNATFLTPFCEAILIVGFKSEFAPDEVFPLL